MQVQRYIAKGQLVPLMFMEDAVAASQTNAQLPSVAVDAVSSLVLELGMPFDGEIVAISATLSVAGSAGSLTLGATVGGTEDANSTITITTETVKSLVIPRGKITFVAGDLIGAEMTSDGSWNGTTADLIVQVWVLLYVEGI